MQIKSIKNKR